MNHTINPASRAPNVQPTASLEAAGFWRQSPFYLEGFSGCKREEGEGVFGRTPLSSQTGVALDGLVREVDLQLEPHVALRVLLLRRAGQGHLDAAAAQRGTKTRF